MSVVLITLVLSLVANCNADYSKILENVKEHKKDDNLTLCVLKILKKYYHHGTKLTHISLNDNEDLFLDDIHTSMMVSVAKRTLAHPLGRSNKSYMIVAQNISTFSLALSLYKDTFWNPYTRFMVVIYHLPKDKLRNVFNILLKLRVSNVVVINGTLTTELYSYNPYEDYACGNYYTKITEYGKCNEVSENLYPHKTVTRLEKCHYRVSTSHWPPFTINPKLVQSKDQKLTSRGVEIEVLNMLSKIEKFTYDVIFDYDPQTFSQISNDFSVTGPLDMLQSNETDIMLGGIFLTPIRMSLFFTVHGYMDYIDGINIIVKRAKVVSPFEDFYLGFSITVWALLFAIFAVYCFIMIMLLKTKDKERVIMVLLDNLLSHGLQIRSRTTVNVVFIIWVWFAYLINCFYTSSLVSRTTKPSFRYQIKNEDDLRKYNLQPCIWNAIDDFFYAELNITMNSAEQYKECFTLKNSLDVVSKSYGKYAMVPSSDFKYVQMEYFDKYGASPFYSFRKPFTKLIYGIYFYKGFPSTERLQLLLIMIRETGLLDKILTDIYRAKELKYTFRKRGFSSRMAMPWHIYVVGIMLSSITLLVEKIYYKKRKHVVRKPVRGAEGPNIIVKHNTLLQI